MNIWPPPSWSLSLSLEFCCLSPSESLPDKFNYTLTSNKYRGPSPTLYSRTSSTSAYFKRVVLHWEWMCPCRAFDTVGRRCCLTQPWRCCSGHEGRGHENYYTFYSVQDSLLDKKNPGPNVRVPRLKSPVLYLIPDEGSLSTKCIAPPSFYASIYLTVKYLDRLMS